MLSFWLGRRYAFSRQRGSASGFLVGMAIASLGIGVALLLLVLAVMSGFDRELKGRILNLVPHISVQSRHVIDAELESQLRDVLQADSAVTSVEPVTALQGLLVRGVNSRMLNVSGVELGAYTEQLFSSFLVDGASLQGKSDVLISQTTATALNLTPGSSVLFVAGDDSLLKRQPKVEALRVAGIFKTETELDEFVALVPLATAQAILGNTNTVGELRVQTDNVLAARSTAYRLYDQLPEGTGLRDWSLQLGNLYQAIQTSRQMIVLMLIVIVAVAAMNIVTAMTMVVTAKTREIAILMTMGLTSRRALQIIFFQGVFIAIIGIFVGTLAGLILALSLTDIVSVIERLLGMQFLRSDIYPITYVPTQIRLSDIISVCVPALFLTLLAALYPAWRATRIMPAQALRYDK